VSKVKNQNPPQGEAQESKAKMKRRYAVHITYTDGFVMLGRIFFSLPPAEKERARLLKFYSVKNVEIKPYH